MGPQDHRGSRLMAIKHVLVVDDALTELVYLS